MVPDAPHDVRGGSGPSGATRDPSPITEAELTELALSVEAGLPPAPDAVPLADYLGGGTPGLLPTWYMPTPMARINPRWRPPVVLTVVAAFVLIEAAGLCSTFGQVVPA